MVDLSGARQQPILASAPLIRQLPPASRLVLRGDSQVIGAAANALGLPRSDAACRAVHNDVAALLWLGPDERLLIGGVDDGAELSGRLQRALAGMPFSLVEVSHAHAAFEVSGDRAAAALNVGCPLDLDPVSFPVDMCTRTVFAKAQILLWRLELDRFRVETSRSFGLYVTKILALAAREADL